MTVKDVFTQNRRLWLRLREKDGKRHAIPCHHEPEEYLTGCLDGASPCDDPKGPRFRTIDPRWRHVAAASESLMR
jgi:integrase/recombinase XerC